MDKRWVFYTQSHKNILKPQLITILPFPPREKANLLELLAWPTSWCCLWFHKIYTPPSQAYLGTNSPKSNTQDVKSICFKCETQASIYNLRVVLASRGEFLCWPSMPKRTLHSHLQITNLDKDRLTGDVWSEDTGKINAGFSSVLPPLVYFGEAVVVLISRYQHLVV